LPRLGTQTKKYVLEVSDAIPLLHVKKMNQLESGVEFDFIQLAHVLEHISNPRNFLEGIIPHLENKGYLYIEVPMEIRECKKLEDGEVEKYHMIIHEHINQFSENSIRLMLGSLKLNVLDCSIEDYRLPWANLSIIRALAQKD
jgi:SAM-dependent methyltransferase